MESPKSSQQLSETLRTKGQQLQLTPHWTIRNHLVWLSEVIKVVVFNELCQAPGLTFQCPTP